MAANLLSLPSPSSSPPYSSKPLATAHALCTGTTQDAVLASYALASLLIN